MKNKTFVNFEKLLDEVISEMSADGGVAGYQAPLGDETNRKLFKKESDENNDKSVDKVFKSGDYEITRSWRGKKKGYTLLIHCTKDNGKEFLNDKKVQNLADYLGKGK